MGEIKSAMETVLGATCIRPLYHGELPPLRNSSPRDNSQFARITADEDTGRRWETNGQPRMEAESPDQFPREGWRRKRRAGQ